MDPTPRRAVNDRLVLTGVALALAGGGAPC